MYDVLSVCELLSEAGDYIVGKTGGDTKYHRTVHKMILF